MSTPISSDLVNKQQGRQTKVERLEARRLLTTVTPIGQEIPVTHGRTPMRWVVLSWVASMGLLVLSPCTHCHAAVQIYLTEASFTAAIPASHSLVNLDSFNTGGGHVALTGQEFLGQGIRFASRLPVSDPQSHLYVEPPAAFSSSNYLSIGRRPFDPLAGGDDDSLIIDLSQSVNAIGFRFVDNAGGAGESISIRGSGGVLYTHPSIPEVFFGVVTDQPITQVVVTESPSDADDMGYDNVRFALVPEPGCLGWTLSLLTWLTTRRPRAVTDRRVGGAPSVDARHRRLDGGRAAWTVALNLK
jgi:hypothetical protein